MRGTGCDAICLNDPINKKRETMVHWKEGKKEPSVDLCPALKVAAAMLARQSSSLIDPWLVLF
uniref:Uncharacterized protein n=1 Tax=Setaria digitata TaxID=48799 RepID=A0A915Q3N0_9BILA